MLLNSWLEVLIVVITLSLFSFSPSSPVRQNRSNSDPHVNSRTGAIHLRRRLHSYVRIYDWCSVRAFLLVGQLDSGWCFREYSSPSTANIELNYFFQIMLLLYIAHVIIHAMWKWKIDPDNSAIPYLTALGDLLGSSLLALAFLFIQSIGHPYGGPMVDPAGVTAMPNSSFIAADGDAGNNFGIY